MIELHYWPTPNGHKIPIFLEEAGLEYVIRPVDIGKGDQFKPDYLAISPNNKMPAIVDTAPADGGAPMSVFESGAILVYLADKVGRFLPRGLRERNETLEWLFWQVGGLGPMTGQYGHFNVYAPEAYRLLGVIDGRLKGREFVAAGEFTIADMAIHPWIDAYKKAPLDLEPYPELRRWHAAIAARPAVQRAYALTEKVNPNAGAPLSEEERKHLFGQGPK